MTCGLNEGIGVEFLESGINLTPYEVSTRSNQKEFSYTKCEVSRDDGERVATFAKEFEPVNLTLDGIIQDRYMFHPEAVDLHNDNADLTLYDAEKVLDQGTINKTFKDSTLHDVIEYILDRREDPNSVINGVKHPQAGTVNRRVYDRQSGGQDGLLGAGIAFFGRGFELVKQFEFQDTSLKFKKMTPFGAIKKTASSFNLETWVDNDGMFRYGLRGEDASGYSLASRRTGIRLKEYNVTVGSGKLTQVVLRGPYRYLTQSHLGPQGETSNSTYAYGKAWLTDEDGERVPGRSLEPEDPISPTNPAAVEDLARMELVRHYRNRENGNIILNAGASTKKKELANISVGDFISAEADIEEHCQRSIETGIFVVNTVKHTLDNRRGWIIDLGVAALPVDEIESESWLEDPSRDVTWDSVDDYSDSI